MNFNSSIILSQLCYKACLKLCRGTFNLFYYLKTWPVFVFKNFSKCLELFFNYTKVRFSSSGFTIPNNSASSILFPFMFLTDSIASSIRSIVTSHTYHVAAGETTRSPWLAVWSVSCIIANCWHRCRRSQSACAPPILSSSLCFLIPSTSPCIAAAAAA